MTKRKNKTYTTEFKQEAVTLGRVELCCTYFAQQYIGSHININASDTMLV